MALENENREMLILLSQYWKNGQSDIIHKIIFRILGALIIFSPTVHIIYYTQVKTPTQKNIHHGCSYFWPIVHYMKLK